MAITLDSKGFIILFIVFLYFLTNNLYIYINKNDKYRAIKKTYIAISSLI